MTTGATMFSGGGVAEALLKNHIDIRWAIEYDPAIAAVYRQNIGDHIIVGDVRHQDYGALGSVDWLHASPVCTRASVANSGAGEAPDDLEMAEAVVRALEAVQPRAFTLENVWPYRGFAAFKRICRALSELGYWFDYEHLNSADFGVPQTRRRLILRATRDRLLPTLPEPTPWRGWYAAIEDLIPTLPETQFAPWQLARLPAEMRESVILDGTEMRENGVSRLDCEPMFTVKAAHWKDAPKAFIVDGQPTDHGARGDTRPGDAPMFTVHAQAGARQAVRAWLVQGTSTLDVRDGDDPSAAVMATVHAKAAMPKAWLVSNAATEYSDGLRGDAEPALAVTHQHGGRLRALVPILMRDDNTGQERGKGYRVGAEPAPTQSTERSFRAWLSTGRVVKMTPRCLARFQSMPDSYELPEKASLATRIIGNGWPSEMALRVVEQLI